MFTVIWKLHFEMQLKQLCLNEKYTRKFFNIFKKLNKNKIEMNLRNDYYYN